MLYAEILLHQKVGPDKDTLTYKIPDNLDIQIGQAVKIPLQKRSASALVWEIIIEKPTFKTREISEIISPQPLLKKEQITLLKWISEYYFCPLYKVFKLFVPARILQGKPVKERKKSVREIIKHPVKTLTPEQQNAIQKILEKNAGSFLIAGVTGSGKTEIYSRLAEEYIKKGHQVLILVPEISLTPQIIEYFENTLGEKASVIHSKLSVGERTTAWQKIHQNEAKLIIGSRSAIFAPFQNLKLIIIDEEHENSYKQDSSPRYRVHEVIEKMQEITPDLKAVFGSATPSIETSEKLKKSTLVLNSRIGESTMPEIEIVDLRNEFKKKNYSIFSEKLHSEIEKALANKEQIILFLNRRGSATCVTCRDCGYTFSCPDCEMPMTYHSRTLGRPILICHHCGKITNPPDLCPTCKGAHIRFLGIGTQKIEEETEKIFPQARILRADRDTVSMKDSFEKIYQDFRNHKADILIGTQMIGKGLHLPKVSLVGVVLADIGLNIPDFRTMERNFQLMLQVAGRAGRSATKGKVIIQTYSPDNPALLYVQAQNYEKFREFETHERQNLRNPPFSHLCKIIIQDKLIDRAKNTAESIENLLWKFARKDNLSEKNLEITCYPAFVMRLRGKYRYNVLIKSFDNKEILHKLLEKLQKEDIMGSDIKNDIKIDVDPIVTT